MLLGLGAIALVAVGFLIVWLLTHRHHHHPPATTVVLTQPRTTTGNGLAGGGVAVPDVRHLKIANAVSVLQSVGLKARTAGPKSGTVFSESPNVGAKVAKGSEVLLVIKGGAPKPATTTTATTNAKTTTAQRPRLRSRPRPHSRRPPRPPRRSRPARPFPT